MLNSADSSVLRSDLIAGMLPGKGRSPVLRNTPLQWPGRKEIAHYGATRLGKTSLQTLSLLASNLYFLRIDLQVVFSGPKTPASSGWRGCVVFGGRQRRMTLLSQAVLIRSKLMCGWWPSSRSRTVAVLVRWATALKNSLVNFNRKTLVVHPARFTYPVGCTCWDSLCPPFVQVYFPLYEMSMGSRSQMPSQHCEQWCILSQSHLPAHNQLWHLNVQGFC